MGKKIKKNKNEGGEEYQIAGNFKLPYIHYPFIRIITPKEVVINLHFSSLSDPDLFYFGLLDHDPDPSNSRYARYPGSK